MDEQSVVELSLRLPAGELGRLARLMEQVWGLLAMEGSGAVGPAPAEQVESSVESGVNTAFDAVRFQRLDAARSVAVREESGPETEAERAKTSRQQDTLDILAVSAETKAQPDEAHSAGFRVREALEAVPAETAVSADPEIPAAKAGMAPGPETPLGSAEAARLTETAAAPAVRMEKGTELPAPPAVPDTRQSLEEARSAGIAVETEPAAAKGGSFAAVEELVSAGPAPLTAEAVALAFQRDDRRYDNGFPLY